MYFNLSVKAIKATVPFGLKSKKVPAITVQAVNIFFSLFFLKVYTYAKKKTNHISGKDGQKIAVKTVTIEGFTNIRGKDGTNIRGKNNENKKIIL